MEATKAVLVTGCSTGIGRKITERLTRAGYFVYAGARKDADLRALSRIENVHAIRLDVTSADDIATAVHVVKQGGRSLCGLVNNAGIVTLGSVIEGNDAEFDLVMDVNVRGLYRITKAFAPLIVAQRGRIIMIGALQGILAYPNASAYSMSKHAVEAFTDVLAAELQLSGVHVSVVEPGAFQSEIGKNASARAGENPKLPDFSQYGEPDDVAIVVVRALFEPDPRRRYMVVPDEGAARRTITKQIEQLVQLNEGHPYTMDRSELVAILDKALVNSRGRIPYSVGESIVAHRGEAGCCRCDHRT